MVLAVLLTVADRVAVHYADKEATHLAAEKYDYDNSTDGHLDVSIEGFSFLTQAFSQKFGHVNLPGLKDSVGKSVNRVWEGLYAARSSRARCEVLVWP
ncbi:LmeA family phospholipid-binding protein, partial [Streptomyces sp. NPDC003996]